MNLGKNAFISEYSDLLDTMNIDSESIIEDKSTDLEIDIDTFRKLSDKYKLTADAKLNDLLNDDVGLVRDILIECIDKQEKIVGMYSEILSVTPNSETLSEMQNVIKNLQTTSTQLLGIHDKYSTVIKKQPLSDDIDDIHADYYKPME